MLVPLFVFALAGVSLTREREAGTLSLLLCQGASISQIVWGKLCGAVLVVSAVLAPGLVIGAGWLTLRGDTHWTGDTSARLLGLAVAHVCFLVTCAALAMAVSAWQRTSRAALVSLIGIWCLLWIVLPRVLPVISTALHPLPACASFDAEVEALRQPQVPTQCRS
jgi:ABC-2 type transport system permease protein